MKIIHQIVAFMVCVLGISFLQMQVGELRIRVAKCEVAIERVCFLPGPQAVKPTPKRPEPRIFFDEPEAKAKQMDEIRDHGLVRPK
jgi:hypothetical protein